MCEESKRDVLLCRIRTLLDELPPEVLDQLIRQWELELGLVEALDLAETYGYGEPADPAKNESDKEDFLDCVSDERH